MCGISGFFAPGAGRRFENQGFSDSLSMQCCGGSRRMSGDGEKPGCGRDFTPSRSRHSSRRRSFSSHIAKAKIPFSRLKNSLPCSQ